MSSVTPVSGADYFGLNGAKKAKSDLDMETFLNLLVVQLANQNPLEPMNDRDFFAQMAQLGQVQGLDKMQDSMEVSQAATLMGKTITAVRPMTDNDNGQAALVKGKVVRMQIVDGERILGIKEANGGIVDVKMENIREINE